jgi:3-deoxy-7-phosphoheptulonate synthase
MNEYIKQLKEQNKLNICIDKTKDFSFKVWDKEIGNGNFTIMAGPCSIEGPEFIEFAKILKNEKVDIIRGGAYKPCTYPILNEVGENGWKEGLKEEGLTILQQASFEAQIPTITEAMSPDDVEKIANDTDIIQVGTRNFQNYALLDELGKHDIPVLLKRGTWGTIDEILGAVERIMVGGNEKVAICLRGTIGQPSYRHVFNSIRWAPDLMMIPALKELTNVPIIFDPSHSTGYSNFVVPMSKAAMAAGADGIIVEVHPDPENSISDAAQAINVKQLREITYFANSMFLI